jgi:hypothetical protein
MSAMRRGVAALGAVCFLLLAPLNARQESHGWFDVPIPGGTATLDALGIAPDERALTLHLLARALYDRDTRVGLTPARVFSLLNSSASAPQGEDDGATIPLPLDPKTWWQLLPPPDKGDLFARVVTDRNALLTAIGLTTADESIRSWLGRDRDLLKFVYQHGASAFAVVARRLQVVDGRIMTPGGPQSDVIWRAVVGEPPSRAGPFLRALITKDAGRAAWYFDAIAGLDEQRLTAAWPRRSAQDATTLYESFRDSDPQWRLVDQPFRRGLADAWTVLTQADLVSDRPVSSLSQELWSLVFSSNGLNGEQVKRAQRDGTPVTLPWLLREVLSSAARERRERFEMFRLAQRVFPDAAPADVPQIALALGWLREYRALMFSLERMGVRDVATWFTAAAGTRHVAEESAERRESLTAYQAMLALIERIRHVRTIDAESAGRLVRSMAETVQGDEHVIRSLSTWIIERLVPALPPLVKPDAFTGKTAYESTILQALAGPIANNPQSHPRLQWEGLTYTVDIVAAEHERLRAMRALLPSPGLDHAIASARPRDVANALTALLYATALGDPEGPASLSPDIVTRHELGLGGTSVVREQLPWSPPEERQGFGPWHVQGSLLGLDLALSRLALRRVADQQMPQAPTLTLNDLGTLTRTAVAMVAADLTDRERDEIAAAIQRGRARVRDAGRNIDALAALAREARLSEGVRRVLPWIAARQPESIPTLFSLGQLLWLGKPQLTRIELDRWGVAADGLDGRRITAMPLPAPWEDFAGRSEAGQVTTQVPDVTLRLVEETARLRLPAVLVPSLLSFALQDYWHDVQARFADDWPQLTRQAALLSSDRIQDYVAALTGSGPLRTQ